MSSCNDVGPPPATEQGNKNISCAQWNLGVNFPSPRPSRGIGFCVATKRPVKGVVERQWNDQTEPGGFPRHARFLGVRSGLNAVYVPATTGAAGNTILSSVRQ